MTPTHYEAAAPPAKEEAIELWLPVPRYGGAYWASNLGRIRRADSGKILKPSTTQGRPHVSLSLHGEIKTERLHILVLSTFCGERPFPEAQCAHNDGDPLNCNLTNLRWAYPAENQRDRIRHKTDLRGSKVYGAVLNEDQVSTIKLRIRQGFRNPPIAEEFGVSISTIHLIRHKKTWRHVR